MESQAFNKELTQYEQSIWYFSQHSRILQEYRDEIAPGWEDSASQDINGRYLNPHREDTEKTQDHLKDHYAKLVEMTKQLEIISSNMDAAYKLSQEVETLVLHCKEDVKKSLSSLGVSKEKKVIAQSSLSTAIDSLNRASS